MKNIIIHSDWKEDIQNYFNRYDHINDEIYDHNIFIGLCEKSNLINYFKNHNLERSCINIEKIYKLLEGIQNKDINFGKISFELEIISGYKLVHIYFFDINTKYLSKYIYNLAYEIIEKENDVILLKHCDNLTFINRTLITNLMIFSFLKRKQQKLFYDFGKNNNIIKNKIENNIFKKYSLIEYKFL